MASRIEFERSAQRELDELGAGAAKPILSYLCGRIAQLYDPRSAGTALNGDRLGRYWKYRVGDHRVVARIDRRVVRILVIRPLHWRELHR